MISIREARSVIAAIDAEPGKTPPDEAARMARTLLNCYPARAVNDADTFATVISAVFAEFSPSLGKRVLNPVHGLAGRLKYLPTVAEVVEALRGEQKRRDLIRANAARTLAEHERRRREAEEAKALELTPEQREQRSKRLSDIMAQMRAKSMEEA